MIDFSTLKAIDIPEGAAKSIAIAGVTVWEKPSADNYTILDYLQFNADMVFDTGVICTNNTKIEVKFVRESSEAKYMYGVRTTNNTASVTAYLSNSGSWRFGSKYKNITPTVGKEYEVTVDKSGLLVNGTLNAYSSQNAFTAPYTLTVGSARSTSGAKTAAQFVGKMYYFRMYDNGNLILDWIPAMNADGTYGFWDNVMSVFVNPM